MRLGHHEYGSSPSQQGALNYARDKYIADALPYYKQVIKAEKHPRGANRGKILLRISGPLFLLVGLVLAGFAFYNSITKAADFGLQSILVDSTVSQIQDPKEYVFKASKSAQMQQFSMRGGEWGRNESLKFLLPVPSEMPENALVFVRNTGTEIIDAQNSVVSSIPDVEIFLGESLVASKVLPGNIFGVPNVALIASKDANGNMAWFDAALMDGAI